MSVEYREGMGTVLGCACWPPALLSASQALQDQWKLGVLVGGRSWVPGWVCLEEALEQCFNAWKIAMSGRDGEEG